MKMRMKLPRPLRKLMERLRKNQMMTMMMTTTMRKTRPLNLKPADRVPKTSLKLKTTAVSKRRVLGIVSKIGLTLAASEYSSATFLNRESF
jgi:hypothetical protein